MGCCGQKRSRAGGVDTSVAPAGPPLQVPLASNTAVAQQFRIAGVHLRYRERSRVLVQGPITGRRYEFSGAAAIQAVDARDADALLKTGYFERVL